MPCCWGLELVAVWVCMGVCYKDKAPEAGSTAGHTQGHHTPTQTWTLSLAVWVCMGVYGEGLRGALASAPKGYRIMARVLPRC